MSEDRDELLLAYLDGELSGGELQRAERLIKDDPHARAFVERHRRIGEQLRAAFDKPMSEEVPEELLHPFAAQSPDPAVEPPDDRVVPFRPRSRVPAPRRWTELAAAAAVALTVGALIGQGVDFGFGERTPGEAGPVLHIAGTIEPDGPLHRVLERTASFAQEGWGEGTVQEATAIPLMSFRSADGRFCREYEMLVGVGDKLSSTIGVACRGEDQVWTDELLVVSKVSDDAGTGYEPASSGGQAALDGFIAETMAGEPLSPEEERRAIADGWR